MKIRTQDLPEELRALVRESVALLGEVIRRELGPRGYAQVEQIRREMAGLRGSDSDSAHRVLERRLGVLRELGQAERLGVARSFALMLELMNACENAYRTFRLRQRPRSGVLTSGGPEAILFVATAHPTEARSPDNIRVFHELQGALTDALSSGFERQAERVRHLLEIAWRVPVTRGRKPTVADEAEHLYSILLREENLEALLAASVEQAPVYLRSWVGGDKDGHPGVDEKAMLRSLTLSRGDLLRYLTARLGEIRELLELGRERELAARARAISDSLRGLRVLRAGDALKVKRLRQDLRAFAAACEKELGACDPRLEKLQTLLRAFPGLVIPLELRESSDLIEKAAAPGGEKLAIRRMLRTLKRLAGREDPRWYARGLIISMAGSVEHVRAAAVILRRELGGLKLPIVPLFEQAEALRQAPRILEQVLRDRTLAQALRRQWGGVLELMVGYSDSSKESGVLPSRIEIREALLAVDRLCRKHRVAPLFFHGSGGSVDRGGGSVGDQTSWWPASALRFYKATVQGEMVERSFASPEIFRGQVDRVVASAATHSKVASAATHGRGSGGARSAAAREFAGRVAEAYRREIADPAFLQLVQQATPYRVLSALKIGSRPSKRGQVLSVGGLRAIPWVLCWTQTRVLFPTWWGVGRAWRETSAQGRAALKRAFREDPLFRSYVQALGFTLAKIEMPVWRVYVERSGLSPALKTRFCRELERELKGARELVWAMSGQRSDLVWFRRWLGTSIRLRGPMIHPLNLLQILAIEDGDVPLLRATVTGISSGMMTTG